MYADFALVFPQSAELKVTYRGNTSSYSIDKSLLDDVWGIAALLGPAICIRRTDTMLLTVSPGIHYWAFFNDSTDRSLHIFGAGVNIQDCITLSSKLCLSIGGDIAYDFSGFSMKEDGSESFTSHFFTFTPKFGVEFKF